MGYTRAFVAARLQRGGYLRLGRLGGASVRLHWSLPFGVFLFTGLRFAPGAWVGFLLIVLVHELGHAVAVVRSVSDGGGPHAPRLRLVAIDVLGVGGLCRFEGYPTPRRRVLIAWSGVLAQAVVLVAAGIVRVVLGRPALPFAADLLDALLVVNAWMIAVNLIPIPPLDGAEAWGVVQLFAAARARRRMEAGEARAAADRARIRAALPPALHALDVEPSELAPMPEEVRRVLDRIMAEGRAQHEAERKK
jgi:Zn-dependent protease